MKKLIIPFFVLAVLFCSVHGLDSKGKEEETECSVSATGEEVCTSKNSDSNGSSSDEIYTDDDNFEEVKEEKKVDDDCVDTHENCKFWAELGECGKNPNYMLTNCAVSCNSCPKKAVKGLTAEQHQEKSFLLTEVAKYGKPQDVAENTQDRTLFFIRKTVDYMKNYIYAENPTHQLSSETTNACRNSEKLCSYWASIGECENNPSFMVTKCAPACLSCHKIDYNMRYAD